MVHFIRQAVIISDDNKVGSDRKDIIIENGVISKIDNHLPAPKNPHREWKSDNLHVSIGWMDVGTFIGEPGFESDETIESASAAAQKGGFTALAPLPTTAPVCQTKADVHFVKTAFEKYHLEVFPMGVISKDGKGTDLSEMYDLHRAGVVGFCDGSKPVYNTGLLVRALQYSSMFGGLIFQVSSDKYLSDGGQMHEGTMSTQLGMKGIPSLAEEIAIGRDIKLVEYTNGKLHFWGISTRQGVELVKKAKKAGLNVSASVQGHHLVFTADDLHDFDTSLKVFPPFREASDKKALWDGLMDGTIDFIASHHTPQDTEKKDLEFPYATFGAIGLETLFAAINTDKPNKTSVSQLVEWISSAPRKLLGISTPTIEVGQKANLTLFDPDIRWTEEMDTIVSKSKNSPYIGKELKGKVLGTVC